MLQEENKLYTKKEVNEKINQAIYEKAKQTYSVAINKMVSDFSLDKYKSRSFDIDKDDVKMYLSNPYTYKKQILDLSLNMFISVPQYQGLIKYFYDMVCLTPYALPIKTSGQKSKIKKDYEEICYQIEKMNIENEFRKVISNVILNGVFYGYEIEENDSYTIKHLDPRYCRVTGTNDGCWMFEFDFSFFNGKRKDESATNELLLNSYPEEFQKKYKLYQKDRQKYQWQLLDLDKEVCIRYFEGLNAPYVDFPPYLNLFSDLMDLEDYKALTKVKNEMANYQFLALEMETNSKDGEMNKFTVDPAIVSEYYDFLVKVCGDMITPFISPIKVTPIKFDKTTENLMDLDSAEKSYWNASGVSDTLFGTGIKTGSGLKYSIMVDENRLSGIYTQISTLLTRKMKRISKNNIFKVILPHVTKYNRDEYIDRLLKLSQYGIGSKLELFAILGNTPSEVLGMLLLEDEILDLVNKLIPLQSSHTMTGEDFSNNGVKGSTRGRPSAKNDSNEDKENPENTSEENNEMYKE